MVVGKEFSKCLGVQCNLMFSLQLIDDLRRELEYLQCFKLEMEHPGKGKGLSEYNARTREIEMEHEVKRLKQVYTHGTHSSLFFRSFIRSLHLFPSGLGLSYCTVCFSSTEDHTKSA